ncbi:MAG: ATP-dependent protease LonB, partial [Peptococcaceae bacterium]|nr:ATP-dependent protease LonB [Peptococcaceae bacterium]
SRKPVDNRLAMTGEVSIRGKVLPVGGTPAKVEAARQAGLKQVLIPKQNWQDSFCHMEGMEVIPVEELTDVVKIAVM